MVDVSGSLKSLFSAPVVEQDGSYVIEIPRQEIEQGEISPGDLYRIGVITHHSSSSRSPETESETRSSSRSDPERQQGPPVNEGDTIEVTIETLGEQGDGIAKVDRGYVIIVSEGQPGDTVLVEIENVRENVAFAEIISN
ncbi:TRAM domain-containing protein [Halobium palmae]|uniref:TRAM domain-containing protein n=1 Tax=Halobium palmae TaxID=1776492 RepID=A0ABD5RW35_9EURY